jgi:hypothetical protein
VGGAVSHHLFFVEHVAVVSRPDVCDVDDWLLDALIYRNNICLLLSFQNVCFVQNVCFACPTLCCAAWTWECSFVPIFVRPCLVCFWSFHSFLSILRKISQKSSSFHTYPLHSSLICLCNTAQVIATSLVHPSSLTCAT